MRGSKQVFTQAHASELASQIVCKKEHDVFTPTQRVAQSIGSRHLSLYTKAVKTIEAQGFKVASPLKTQALFLQSLQEIMHPEDVYGVAKAWRPTIESLLKSCQSLAEIPESLSARSQQVLQVGQHYQASLRELGIVDPNEIYWRASELSLVQAHPVLIYGYCQPRVDELAWIQKLAAPNSLLFLPAKATPLFADIQGSLEWLKNHDWVIQTQDAATQALEHLSQVFLTSSSEPLKISNRDANQGPDPTVQAFCYSSVDAEVRGTLARIKVLLNDGIPAKEIAVVARNETEYGPRLIDIAWEYEIPFRALYATPLMSTRLGAWLNQLLEAIAHGFPFETTAKLLSHPLCSNPDSEFWARVRRDHPQGLKQWGSHVTEILGLDLTVLARVNQIRRRDNWVSWWQSLFKTFDLRRRCARWARESLAFNSLQDALVELAKPEDQKLSWPEFRQQLRNTLELLSVPAQPGRGGVELHSPLSMVGTRYRYVFVLGMAEGTLPASIQNDPVLDFFERQLCRDQSIQLPLAAELARRESLDFYGLLQTVTKQVTFSYPKLKGRQVQLPSPYLEGLGLKAVTPPNVAIASIEEYRRICLRDPQSQKYPDKILPHILQALTVEQHRESSQAPNEFDGVVGIPFDYRQWSFSVSQLTNLGQCPFKWFADKLLQLGAPDEPEEELSPRLRGNLYHKVLELLVPAIQSDPSKKLTDPNLLNDIFLEAEAAVQLTNVPLWTIRREECLQQLARTLQKPDFWSLDADPMAIEQQFQGEWNGLKVTGRVDRIDRTPHGLVLIDYKTSGSIPKGVKDTNGKANIDLQLPLYQEVAAQTLCPDEPVADAYYYSLTKGKAMRLPRSAPQHQLPEVVERLKSHVDQGSYPVKPDNSREACRYCDFDLVCRQGNRLSRKEHDGTH